MLDTMWVAVLQRYRGEKPRVIAVGGSVGKTSTKEALIRVLQATGRPVRYTFGNQATDMGVALSLLGFSEPPNGAMGWLKVLLRCFTVQADLKGKQQPYYILEYSSDAVGDTDFLTKRIPPDVAVLTTIVPVHMGSYKTEAAMQEETLRLVAGLREGGSVVANADDPIQRQNLVAGNVPVAWYGILEKKAEPIEGLYADEIKQTEQGLSCRIAKHAGTQTTKGLPLETKMLAPYQLYPLVAAATVGIQEGLMGAQIKTALESYELPSGRGRLIAGHNEMTIIDDSANSSPAAVLAGLQVLKMRAKKRRKVAILGTMNELGDQAEASHREIGAGAAVHADYFVALGQYHKLMLAAARKAGMEPRNMIGFQTPEQLIPKLEQIVRRGDLIYVKASQNGMFLERVVKNLMAHPEEAATQLVRQSGFWRHTHPEDK